MSVFLSGNEVMCIFSKYKLVEEVGGLDNEWCTSAYERG